MSPIEDGKLGRFGSVLRRGNNRALRRRFGRLLQAGQRGNQLRVVALSFAAAHVDTAQHLADRIHHAQQRRGQLRVERKLSIPQPSQQVLPNMRNLSSWGNPESRRCL